MPVDDRSRLELHRRLGEVLGAHEAETLMDHFSEISVRFDRVDSRLERVDSRLDRVDSRLDRVDSRLERLENRMELLDGRMALLEEHFTVFAKGFDTRIESLFVRQTWRMMAMMIALVAVLLAGVGVLG
jgi:predicted nuclease with TOPRIM domain